MRTGSGQVWRRERERPPQSGAHTHQVADALASAYPLPEAGDLIH
jgi:hypothetical protein